MAKEDRKMNLEKLNRAIEVLKRDHQRHWIPGYEAIVIFHGETVLHTYGGFAEDTPNGRRPMRENIMFDMASLTKVMVTATAILLLLEQGEIHLGDPVAHFIPEFGRRKKQNVTIRQLLTHTSGLAAHRDLYSHGYSQEEILRQIYDQDLLYPPDNKMVYSDLGFIVLGEVIRKITGIPLDRFAKDYIFSPLSMKDTTYLPTRNKDWIAATEYRKDLGRFLCGEVHDENAWALGGVAGHAGLFSTAKDTAKFVLMWLNEGSTEEKRFLSPLTIKAATLSYTPSIPNANRGLGWALKGDAWDTSGNLSSPFVFGHTGFTGTSITIDPTYSLGVILLTNRVHYSREPFISQTRIRFNNTIYASLE